MLSTHVLVFFLVVSDTGCPSEGAEQEGPSLAAWEDAFRCAYKKLVLNIRRSTVVQWRPIFLYLFDDIKIITCIRFCGSN